MKIMTYSRFAWDVSTPAKERAAFCRLFEFLDREVHMYEPDNPYSMWTQMYGQKALEALYSKAKKGNFKAIKELAVSRYMKIYSVSDPIRDAGVV
jgi:hypothetical protein